MECACPFSVPNQSQVCCPPGNYDNMENTMTDPQFNSDPTKLEFPELPAPRRDPHQSRWKTTDLLVLIAAKRFEVERLSFGKSRDKSRSAGLRWKEVENFCRRNNVNRKAGQCRKRWEKLMTDFKKIYDYQKRILSGQLGYFDMSSDEWKRRKLPLNFLHEWYKAMEVWVPNHRTVSPDPNQIMDSTAGDNFPNHSAEPGTQSASPLTLQLDDEDITDAGDVSPEADARTEVGGEEDGSSRGDDQPSNEVPGNNTMDTAPSVSDVRGWKRIRREKSDDQFVKLIGKFLEAVSADSVKRNLHEADFLAFERQKQANDQQRDILERQKHADQMAQAKKIASEVSGALKEVSASLRFFATEIAKKL